MRYKNSKPCVGVLLVEKGQLLLVQRGIEPFKGYWDIPGGFLEEGEHPEAGALREFLEETGLLIELTELLGFFMDVYGPLKWSTLNICFLAKAVSGQAQAGSDAAGLGWFPLDALPDRTAFHWESEALERLKKRHRQPEKKS